MNTQDDPRFTTLTFPCAGYYIRHWHDTSPSIMRVVLLSYDLSSPDCSVKTILYRDPAAMGSARVRCSTEMIFVSVEEAKEHIREEMEEAVVTLRNELNEVIDRIATQMKVCKDWLRDNPKP